VQVDELSHDEKLSSEEDSFILEADSWQNSPEDILTSISDLAPTPRESRTSHIVVVDDNADMRGYITSILGSEFNHSTFADGEAAYAAILENPPDLILSDVMMPKLDGFGLIDRIRKNPDISAIPIILLSARAGNESRVVGLQSGADDYLVKPFSSQELVTKIRTLLDLGQIRTKFQEDRMYSVFMQTSVGIAILEGPEHRFALANPMYMSTLFGSRDLVGKPVREALPELEGQGLYEVLDEVYQTGKPYIAVERYVKLRQGDGTLKKFFLDFVYQPKLSLRGEVEGILVVVNDVTDRVMARKETEKLAESLKEALVVRDDFLSIASHELKTPITSLKLQLQLTRRTVKPKQNVGPPLEKLARALDMSNQQVNRLVDLVEDLLDVSKIRTGQLSLKPEPMSLSQLMRDLWERFTPVAAQAKTPLTFAVEEEVSGEWDRLRLDQVVSNLISNALKYASGKPIELALEKKDEGVLITVTDGGPGITLENQTMIFERFERANISKNISGLGLGLYLAKAIVLAHDGRIWVKSVPGNGSVFGVELPFQPNYAKKNSKLQIGMEI
jgi:signal transduction histidine kinase/CheY-like chemotaxis protein